MKQFFKTTFTVTVLSDEIIVGLPLEHLNYAVTEGDCVLHGYGVSKEEILDGRQMADALYDAGSQPEFFHLDDNGNLTNV